MGNQYSVMLREAIYIGGHQFEQRHRADGDTIDEALRAIQSKSLTVANRWSSPFAKAKYGDNYKVQFDYTGRPGYLKMDQHNPAVLTFRGYWSGEAQSDNHVSPSISVELCFQSPTGYGIRDTDVYHLLTYFYVNHFNVYYESLPSQRRFYRESAENVRNKNNAEGLQFPPSFIIPPNKEVA